MPGSAASQNAYIIYLAYHLVRYGRVQAPDWQREFYRWITIGGVPDPKTGERHKGGTPVNVNAHGEITVGPPALRGQNIASLPKKPRPDAAGQRTLWGETQPLHGPQKRFEFTEPPPKPKPPKRPPQPQEPQGRHPIPPGPRRLDDGRIVGHALVTVDELTADPEKFQYKTENVDPETGVTAELKEVDIYRPEFGGQLLVWRDPKTGTNYVVNGHHRFELAKRSKYKGPMAVYFIDAKSPSEARAIGALANIAEGRGTALDAARFMREYNLGPEELKKNGISLKGQLAAKAAVLRHLTPHLFQELSIGRLSEAHAVAIGTHLWDEPDLQEQLFRDLQNRGRFSVEELEEVAREMKQLSQASVQRGLFGEEEVKKSYIWEKAYLRAHIKRRLGEQLRAFSVVAQERKAHVLETAGNVIAHEANRRRKQQLEEAQWLFEIEASRRGEISRLLNEYAEMIFRQPRAKKTIAEEAYHAIFEKLGLPQEKSSQDDSPSFFE